LLVDIRNISNPRLFHRKSINSSAVNPASFIKALQVPLLTCECKGKESSPERGEKQIQTMREASTKVRREHMAKNHEAT
jgi:hypothetical protein